LNIFGFPPYPYCPVPLAFYPVVNIALIWVGAPLAAYLGMRNIAIGLSFWGLILLNGIVHVAGTIALRGYNPGLLSGLLFIPLSFWVIYTCGFRRPHSGKLVAVAFAACILAHILLGLGYLLLKIGAIGGVGLLSYAVVLGFAPIIFAVIGGRVIRPVLPQPAPTQ
jgi:hypothetical protein